MLSRFLRAAALLVLLLAVGVPGWVYLHLEDPPFDDSHLRVARVAVTPEENGIRRLTALGERISTGLLGSEALDDRGWAPDVVAGFLAENEYVFAEVDRVLASSVFQVPPVRVESLAGDEVLPPADFSTGWGAVGGVLRVRAIARARAGDADGAFADALRAVRLGERVQRAHGATVLTTIGGSGLLGIGSDALRSSLAHLAIGREAARALLAELPEDAMPLHVWRAAWVADYEVQRAMLRDLAAQPADELLGGDAPAGERALPVGYLYKPNATMRLFGERVEREAAAGDRPCHDLDPARPESGPGQQLRTLLGPNSVGVILASIQPETPLQHYRCRDETALTATRTLIALRAFEQERGMLPERLDELVPEFLPTRPLDGFDGKPLRYDREARTLRSIGWGDTSGDPPAALREPPSWPLPWDPPGPDGRTA